MGPLHRGSLILSRLNGLRMPSGDYPAPLLESPDSQIGHELVLYQVDLLLICSPRFILFYLIFFRLFVSFLFLPSSSSPRLSLSLSLSLFSLPLTLTGSPVFALSERRLLRYPALILALLPFFLLPTLPLTISRKGEMRSNGSSSRILSSPGSTNGPASPHGSSDTKLTAFSPEDVRSKGRSESSVDAPLNDGGFCRLYSL